MESQIFRGNYLRIILVLLPLPRDVTSVDLTTYYNVHPGRRYENVTLEYQELSLGTCNINCAMQKQSLCFAFNYRDADQSCQLILNGMSRLVVATGFQSFVQSEFEASQYHVDEFADVIATTHSEIVLCLREYPTIENAKTSFVGWNGEYPAPKGGIVTFRCEHSMGFSDGAHLHTAECAPFEPDSWCTSFLEGAVHCEKVPTYPECRLTEKGKEYVGRMSVTESGRKCLNWRDYPHGRPKDFPDIILQDVPESEGFDSGPPGMPVTDFVYEGHFLNRDSWSHHNYCRNPTGKERPWCFVSDSDITWEYCNIPMCTDRECKMTQQGGEYMGTKNVTITGAPCLPWRKREDIIKLLPAFPDADRVDANHNFCRNPTMEVNVRISDAEFISSSPYVSSDSLLASVAPWCYIHAGGNITWGFCEISFCDLLIHAEEARSATYPECLLSEKGKEYVGNQSSTETGKPCLFWDSHPHLPPWDFYPRSHIYSSYFTDSYGHMNMEIGHNHCRNPGLYRERPWCFVSDNGTEWEYCDIPLCQDLSPPECKRYQEGREYMGKRNVTITGVPCLHWFMFLYDVLSLSGSSDELDGKHAFCRNYAYTHSYGPWCHTTLEGAWEYCDVPFCPSTDAEICNIRVRGLCVSPLECKTDVKGKSYMGTKNMTAKGHKCLPWMSISQREQNNLDYYDHFRYQYSSYEGMEPVMTSDDMHPQHNFCRNTIVQESGPWCYVSDGYEREICDIPICNQDVP